MNGPLLVVELQARVGFDRVHRLPRDVFDHVDIAQVQRGIAQILVGIGDELDALQLRKAGLVELVEGGDLDGRTALLPDEPERAGADQSVGVDFRGAG